MDDIVGELRDCAADSQQVGYRSRAQEAMLRAADDIVALQGQSNRQCDMVNKLVATLETVTTERDALRAEREKSLADARESDRLLKVAEQTIAAQDERVAALRARIAELEAAGRAVLACTDKVCGLPGKCFKHCEADAMLRAVLPTGTRHE